MTLPRRSWNWSAGRAGAAGCKATKIPAHFFHRVTDAAVVKIEPRAFVGRAPMLI